MHLGYYPTVKTRDLTNGELFLLQRRRDQKTQRAAAADNKVTLYCYRRWEDDEDEGTAPTELYFDNLEPYEACFIRRRRAGVSLQDLADQLELSRWWVCKMEYGRANAARLVDHWAQVDRPWRPRLAASRA